MRAELLSNIRNPLSCMKTSCFLVNSLVEKENIQSEKLREYLQIIEKAAEDIESTLK
jgi:nitrogen-specific signal transduction histidine kinase